MKNARPVRPTRRQKEIISELRLNTEQYLVCCESEHTISLYNKNTGKTITRYKKEHKK